MASLRTSLAALATCYMLQDVSAQTGSSATPAPTGSYVMSVAGNGSCTSLVCDPEAITLTTGGALFSMPSMHAVRLLRQDMTSIIVAGTFNSSGYSGDGGFANASQLNKPYGMAFDGSSNTLYIADSTNNRIRAVLPNSTIITFAGNGVTTSSRAVDNVAATSSPLMGPMSCAFDPNTGSLFIAELAGNRIRRVQRGIITTVAGSTQGTNGSSGDGGAASSALLFQPAFIVLYTSGGGTSGQTLTMYFTDMGNLRIRNITLSSVASGNTIGTYAGNGAKLYSGDGGQALNASFLSMATLAVDSKGSLFISDPAASVIRYVNASTGIISTQVGSGVFGFNGDYITPLSTQLNAPVGLAYEPQSGSLFIADSNNNRLRRAFGVPAVIQPAYSPSPSMNATVSATATRSINATNATATSTYTSSYTVSPSRSPNATATFTSSYSMSATPSMNSSRVANSTYSAPNATVTATFTSSYTVSATASINASRVANATAASWSPSINATASVSYTTTASYSMNASVTSTMTATFSRGATASVTPTMSVTSSLNASLSRTPSRSSSVSANGTSTASMSSSISLSPTASMSYTSTATSSASFGFSNSNTPSPTSTWSTGYSSSASPSVTSSITPSISASNTGSNTPTISLTSSVSSTSSFVPSASATPSQTGTPSVPASTSSSPSTMPASQSPSVAASTVINATRSVTATVSAAVNASTTSTPSTSSAASVSPSPSTIPPSGAFMVVRVDIQVTQGTSLAVNSVATAMQNASSSTVMLIRRAFAMQYNVSISNVVLIAVINEQSGSVTRVSRTSSMRRLQSTASACSAPDTSNVPVPVPATASAVGVVIGVYFAPIGCTAASGAGTPVAPSTAAQNAVSALQANSNAPWMSALSQAVPASVSADTGGVAATGSITPSSASVQTSGSTDNPAPTVSNAGMVAGVVIAVLVVVIAAGIFSVIRSRRARRRALHTKHAAITSVATPNPLQALELANRGGNVTVLTASSPGSNPMSAAIAARGIEDRTAFSPHAPAKHGPDTLYRANSMRMGVSV